MKTLLLIRHAKSDWNNPALSDFDRPLNERGKKDAPRMAEKLKERKIRIDAFISSPAKRARKTASHFARVYNTDKEEIQLKTELYLAGEDVFYEVVENINDKYECVALFSHNPGITDFANTLTLTRIDNIPTSGIFAVSVDAKKWKDFRAAPKNFLFFDFPKAMQQESNS